ncbi:carbohydrate ABC transporter permease [Butyrivibrio fibrisolvens]|jgi:raffinose/stachyose/melibiose transport system permease protein|uniref:carbohydrate ABC transporter permease n=1 Tax=Butyrivibrio fibrisolvens TaxID=831 RepID=UPI0003B77D58|nr:MULTISPECIES: carbohydrate ABC transporter permease [Butyrivibrio]MCR4636482.1 carbohydrate ABC transporter permease [Butyrivibrio sp.]
MKRNKLSLTIIYILLGLWALTTIYPLFWVLENSFKAKDKILNQSFVLPLGDLFTLANYKRAFERLDIFHAYVNSIFISTCVTIGVMALAGLAAFALVRFNFKLRNFLYTMVIAAMMFPVFSTIIPVYTMETRWHITNTSSWGLNMLSVILPQIAGNVSFAIIVLMGYVQSLPLELEEAAHIEGCSIPQIFVKIVVPLGKPSFVTVAIFSFLWSYNDLFTQMFFLRRPEMQAITRLLNELTSKEGTNYGLMAAAVTLVVIPVIVVYIFLQKYIIKGMTAGAVKG